MPGFSDYMAKNSLGWITGAIPFPALPSVFLALFTTAPTADAGTGGTEVSGNGYARVQVAGQLATSGSTSTSSATITLSANAPSWLNALGTGGGGVGVWSSAGVFLGTIASGGTSTSSATVTLTGNANAVASGTFSFSAFGAPAASGSTEPTITPANSTNGATVTFAQATGAGWGSVLAVGFYDAVTSGNFLGWDFLGTNKWIPFSASQASPTVFTVDNAADCPVSGSNIVVTQKYGGTLPSVSSGSFSTIPLTTGTVTTNTFPVTGVNTSSVGGGQFRQILVQAIAGNVTASFAPGTMTISVA